MWIERALRLWSGTYLGAQYFGCSAARTASIPDAFQWTTLLQRQWCYHISTFRASSTLASDEQVLPNHTDPVEESAPQTAEDFRRLITNEETERQIKLILAEYEMNKLTHHRIPTSLSVQDMQELMELKSVASRRKYQNFVFKKQVVKLAGQRKKAERQAASEAGRAAHQEAVKNRSDDDYTEYRLGKNTIFHRLGRVQQNLFYNLRQASAFIHGQPIVVDLDYDRFMAKRECKNLAEQLQEVYGANRIHRQPFALHFCNCRPTELTAQFLKIMLPHISEPNCLIDITEKSYLELFPKERLVYLTPHVPNMLQSFDHDAIYIIGGIVDKSINQPVSLAKAKREGLKMAKLPLDHYLLWGCGNKSLPLNQIMQIMLEIKYSGDWDKAMQYVPRRKLKRLEEENNPMLQRSGRTAEFRTRTMARSLFHDKSD